MTRKPSLLLGVFAAMALALAATSGASAHFPRFKNHKIVPGRSIGGLNVGMTKKQARKAWGRSDKVDTVAFKGYTWYQWLVPVDVGTGKPLLEPKIGYFMHKGTVAVINVELPDDPVLATKVKVLKTSKRIGLDDSMAAARSAYGIPRPGPGEAAQSRANLKQGKSCTLFYAPTSPWTTIESITVGRCGAVPGHFGP
jgi:outer membrane protein assembly factor BamE (lipoprotein component of BamABCDE complex)